MAPLGSLSHLSGLSCFSPDSHVFPSPLIIHQRTEILAKSGLSMRPHHPDPKMAHELDGVSTETRLNLAEPHISTWDVEVGTSRELEKVDWARYNSKNDSHDKHDDLARPQEFTFTPILLKPPSL
jgi:hypothetical protein